MKEKQNMVFKNELWIDKNIFHENEILTRLETATLSLS